MTYLHLTQDRTHSSRRRLLLASVLLSWLSASLGLAQEGTTSAAAPATSAPLGDSGGPLVQTLEGAIQGLSTTTPTRVFLGIPYAQAPVGALRFRPALPMNRWSGIRRTDSFGPACPQPRGGFAAEGPQSEDCLSLNVFAANRANNNAPVMVFIHVIVQQLPPLPKYTTDTDRHISIRSTSVEGTGLSKSDCDFLESIGAVQ